MMGMFDYVKCRAMSCPGCGGDLGWQSKDGPCVLSEVYVMEIMREAEYMSMIGSCDECGWFVDTQVRRDRSMTPGQAVQRMRERQGFVPTFDEEEIQ